MKKTGNPLVSIIIPTHGRTLYLGDAVSSALMQTYSNIEVLVVDDNGAGTDFQKESEQLLKGGQGQFASVSYLINESNLGVAASRNRAAEKAKGDYLAFLDDDDVFEPQKIEQHMRMADEVDISLCGYMETDEYLNNQQIRHQPLITSVRDFLTLKVYSQASTQLIKKDLFLKVGGFPEDLTFREDSILIMRALAVGGSIASLNIPLFKHRKHSLERLSKRNKSTDELAYIHARYCEEQNPLLKVLDNSLSNKLRFKREYDYFKMQRKNRYRFDGTYIIQLMQLGMRSGNVTKIPSILWKSIH